MVKIKGGLNYIFAFKLEPFVNKLYIYNSKKRGVLSPISFFLVFMVKIGPLW